MFNGNYKHKTASPWGTVDKQDRVLVDMQTKAVAVPVRGFARMSCCGLEELNFQPLQNVWDQYKHDSAFPELVAKYIRNSINEQDARVVIVGIPTLVGGASMYNLEFYRELRRVLEEFGFRQVGKVYKNMNSSNTITALVGQMPA